MRVLLVVDVSRRSKIYLKRAPFYDVLIRTLGRIEGRLDSSFFFRPEEVQEDNVRSQ
jgi:hypothetical protein